MFTCFGEVTNKAFTLNSRHMLIAPQSTQSLGLLRVEIKIMTGTSHVEYIVSQTFLCKDAWLLKNVF